MDIRVPQGKDLLSKIENEFGEGGGSIDLEKLASINLSWKILLLR